MSDTKNIIQEVRSFFKRISWKKILTFLFFVLLSSVFWIMQIYRQKFEASFSIPVRYVNVPDSVVFESDLPLAVNVRIKDDGAALFKYYFTRRRDSLTIDVRKMLREPSDNLVLEMLRKQLFVTSELLNYYPEHISFIHASLLQKKVPVIYDGHVELAAGYIMDGEITVTPDSVMVYGSKAALDTINYAHTVSDTLKNVASAQNVSVRMRPIRGIKYVPSLVELSIPADEFTLKEVEVPVVCINLPSNLKITFFPSMVKIPFFVGLRRYNYINAEDFKVMVDYNEIKDSKETSIPVSITESPDYIRTKIPVPSEVEFILEQE